MTMAMASKLLAAAAVVGIAGAGGLEDIEHVILFMQENRSFDHYFGTMPGVRGFNDPNIHYNGNQPVWTQHTKENTTMSPWYLNYAGDSSKITSQCVGYEKAGPNWDVNRWSYNYGANDLWPIYQSTVAVGFFKQDDIPTQWALADNYVLSDMYQSSVLSNTDPNRVFWMSGSINVPGSPQTKDQGGYPYIQTGVNVDVAGSFLTSDSGYPHAASSHADGCDPNGINCLPLKWKTVPEHYQDAGVDWAVFQDDENNFGDNPLVDFKQFRDATDGPLTERGKVGRKMEHFFEGLKDGSLPTVSYIIGPADQSEHDGFSLPTDGGSLQDQVARAVIQSPLYNKTALIISYDEGGGWFDHVIPYHSPPGTPGEWLVDPIADTGYTFAGPGIRVPMYIISPWTRNGGVFTEHADHTSQILFVEKWLAAKGKNVKSKEVVHWRRDNMADLVNAFDFDNPDFSIPNLPEPPAYLGYDRTCDGNKEGPQPPNDGGNGLTNDMGSTVGKGFKPVRGKLTEGRRLVIEMDNTGLSHAKRRRISGATARKDHDDKGQQWIVRTSILGGNDFTLQSSGGDGYYICHGGLLCKQRLLAQVFTVDFVPGKGHSFNLKFTNKYMVGSGGKIDFYGHKKYWNVFSVNY